jgi:hypothetical protein
VVRFAFGGFARRGNTSLMGLKEEHFFRGAELLGLPLETAL